MNDEAPAFSEEEAARRFAATERNDPFPDIPPALLNSADIDDYVRATGMIWPYYPDKLKSASYEAQIGKLAIFWKDGEKKQEIDLERENEVFLEPNSLIYLATLPFFRLPDYMALRFNLRITNVHQGLLLGTGPLVDPGFEGHLLIPVHNFTTNTYKFEYKSDFIWIEFTKISPNETWISLKDEIKEGRKQRSGIYIPFPDTKKQQAGQDIYEIAKKYLTEAAPHLPLQNAIPETRRIAKKAERSVNNIYLAGALSLALTLALAFLGYYIAIHPIVQESVSLSVTTNDLVTSVRREVISYEAKIQQLQEEISKLSEEVEALSADETSTQNESTEDQP